MGFICCWTGVALVGLASYSANGELRTFTRFCKNRSLASSLIINGGKRMRVSFAKRHLWLRCRERIPFWSSNLSHFDIDSFATNFML